MWNIDIKDMFWSSNHDYYKRYSNELSIYGENKKLQNPKRPKIEIEILGPNFEPKVEYINWCGLMSWSRICKNIQQFIDI